MALAYTGAQFLEGTAMKGPALGLRIAADNVPNFVDLSTGGWGEAIQGPLNSGQTPTMANFATLADVLAGCATRVSADACDKLFAAATPPKGAYQPTRWRRCNRSPAIPGTNPGGCSPCSTSFYPVPPIKLDGQPKPPNMRAVPFMPYLVWAPSAWVLPLKFDGGGYRAGGKAMFDSEGNLWVGDNFTARLAGAGRIVAGQCHQVRPQW